MTATKTQTPFLISMDEDMVAEMQDKKHHVEQAMNDSFHLYPDTETVDNDDLRAAYVSGVLYGYWAVLVLGVPGCSADRLQEDAFMKGVKVGEDLWREDNLTDEDRSYLYEEWE